MLWEQQYSLSLHDLVTKVTAEFVTNGVSRKSEPKFLTNLSLIIRLYFLCSSSSFRCIASLVFISGGK